MQVPAIERSVLFVGNARSGSSLTAALLDAHPHCAIAHRDMWVRDDGGLRTATVAPPLEDDEGPPTRPAKPGGVKGRIRRDGGSFLVRLRSG